MPGKRKVGMNMKKMLFIYNPLAGKNHIKSSLSDILEVFTKSDYQVTVYPTKRKEDATNLTIEYAKEFDLLVCAGGDGTLNEVVNGMMQCKEEEKRPIGYLPAGTTNDFGESLKLPKNILKAAEVVVNGENFPCDIGLMDNKYFNYFAGFGAFTNVSYNTPQASKNVFGRMAYILEGVKYLPTLKTYNITVNCAETDFTAECIYGMITNSDSVGGFKGLAGKDVLLNDGLFEAAFIKAPKNPIELQAIINALLTGDVNSKYIYSFRTKHLEFYSEEIVPWTVDGEYAGDYKRMKIDNLQCAVNYIKMPEKQENW